MLKRILPAIGHIKLGKLQPHHLIQFYNNLDEEGVRLDGRFTPTKALIKYLEPLTISHIIKTTGISSKTCRRLKNGQATNYSTAQKLCNCYKLDFNRMFKGNSEKKQNFLQFFGDRVFCKILIQWQRKGKESLGIFQQNMFRSGFFNETDNINN